MFGTPVSRLAGGWLAALKRQGPVALPSAGQLWQPSSRGEEDASGGWVMVGCGGEVGQWMVRRMRPVKRHAAR